MLLEMDVKLRRGNFVLNSQLELNDINTSLMKRRNIKSRASCFSRPGSPRLARLVFCRVPQKTVFLFHASQSIDGYRQALFQSFMVFDKGIA